MLLLNNSITNTPINNLTQVLPPSVSREVRISQSDVTDSAQGETTSDTNSSEQTVIRNDEQTLEPPSGRLRNPALDRITNGGGDHHLRNISYQRANHDSTFDNTVESTPHRKPEFVNRVFCVIFWDNVYV